MENVKKDICLCCPPEQTDKADETEDDNLFFVPENDLGLCCLKDTAYRPVCALL